MAFLLNYRHQTISNTENLRQKASSGIISRCEELLSVINSGSYSASELQKLDCLIGKINRKLKNGELNADALKGTSLLEKSINDETISVDQLELDRNKKHVGSKRTVYIYPDGRIYKISSYRDVLLMENHLDLRLNDILKEPLYNGLLSDFSYKLKLIYSSLENKYITMISGYQDKNVRPLSQDEYIKTRDIEILYNAGYRFADLKPKNFAVVEKNRRKIIFPIDAKYIGLQRSNSLRSLKVINFLKENNSPHEGTGLDSYEFYHRFKTKKHE